MGPLRILIVEDNLIEANDIRETLERAGHSVSTIVRTYTEAIQSVRQTLPDVALIDIRLDGSSADGIKTASDLWHTFKLPFLFLTGTSDYETFRRATQTQPAAYLLKPFRQTELAMQTELAYYNFRINQETKTDAGQSNKLYLYLNRGYESIAKDNIVCVKADGSYSMLYLANPPATLLLSVSVGYLDQFLLNSNFHRLNRSFLINLDYLERLETDQIVMSHMPTPIPLARGSSNRQELTKKIMLVKNRN